ncbi:actin binding protein [Marasmius tenuissimus]|nr:actin binding protein [Marasmius tenuissimus]
MNLYSTEISEAYLDVLNSHETGGTDWAIFTYEGGTNDLKVQGTGDRGLEELEEEFSDGR